MRKRRSTRRPPAARALLRLPADLHESLTAAAAEGLSFNAYCLRRLSAPRALGETSALQALVLDRARAAAGEHLAGVVVLGSWARGEAAADSDIDVLIVIAAHAPLTRDTYRDWDQASLTFEGRPIAAHLDRLVEASRALRRDRELAFYGAEDLTPSAFYRETDAVLARDLARHLAGAAARRFRWTRKPAEGASRLSVRQSLLAALAGVSLFAKARRKWTTIPAPDYRGIAASFERS